MSTFTRRTLVRAAAAGGFGVLANSYGPVARAGSSREEHNHLARRLGIRQADGQHGGTECPAEDSQLPPWEGEFRAAP